MSFTDGKPQIATEEDCQARWSGRKPGERFRCGLCGYKFKVGDQWRWLYTNSLGNGGIYCGNPLVCASCDDEHVIDKWKALCDEYYSDKFWHFRWDD